uniref:CSON008013 protein n=1 Tax=Culicoides sonorensis TaxID=179676 RepID=A0A336M3M2_CULSO
MFSKVFVVLATIAYVAAQEAARYPAGVDPSRCPGFPICDNAALHNVNPVPYSAPSYHQPQYYSAPAPTNYDDTGAYDPRYNDPNFQGNNGGYYQAPAPVQHYQPAPVQYAAPVSNHIAAPAADKYPAGVSPNSCPNYPYCDVNAGHNGPARAAPLPGFTERLYPAGVNPSACPNFPDCPIGQ